MIHITVCRVGHGSPSFGNIPFSWLVAWAFDKDDKYFELDPVPLEKIAEEQPLLVVVRWQPSCSASTHDHYGFRQKEAS